MSQMRAQTSLRLMSKSTTQPLRIQMRSQKTQNLRIRQDSLMYCSKRRNNYSMEIKLTQHQYKMRQVLKISQMQAKMRPMLRMRQVQKMRKVYRMIQVSRKRQVKTKIQLQKIRQLNKTRPLKTTRIAVYSLITIWLPSKTQIKESKKLRSETSSRITRRHTERTSLHSLTTFNTSSLRMILEPRFRRRIKH